MKKSVLAIFGICILSLLNFMPAHAMVDFDPNNPFGLMDGMTAEADAQGFMATILVDKKALLPLLPEGASLKNVPLIPASKHPVAIFIGTHKNLRASMANGVLLAFPGKYNEILLAITNVMIPEYNGTYTYIPRNRVDSLKAIFMGQSLGVNREYSRFNWEENSVRIFDYQGGERARASFTVPEIFNASVFEQRINFLASGERPVLVERVGGFQCMNFSWGLKTAKTQPATWGLELSPSFASEVAGKFEVKGLDQSMFGGFMLDTTWTMKYPRDCE